MANLSNINGKFVVEQTTGYVGVGTTDPNFLIEAAGVNSEIALNSTSGSIYRVRSTSSDEFIITKNGVGDRLVISGAGNATFTGNVISGGSGTFASSVTVNTNDSNILTLNRNSTVGGYMVFRNSNSDKLYIGSRGTVSGSGGAGYDIFTVAGNDLKLFTSATLALTLDTSQYATFAGMITVNGGGIDIDNNDDVRLRFDNASVFKAGVQVATTAGDMIEGSAINDFAIRAQENMLFSTGGNTEKMRIASNGDITIQENLFFNNGAAFRGAASIRQQSDILILTGGGNGFAFNDDTNAVSNMLIAQNR